MQEYTILYPLALEGAWPIRATTTHTSEAKSRKTNQNEDFNFENCKYLIIFLQSPESNKKKFF